MDPWNELMSRHSRVLYKARMFWCEVFCMLSTMVDRLDQHNFSIDIYSLKRIFKCKN